MRIVFGLFAAAALIIAGCEAKPVGAPPPVATTSPPGMPTELPADAAATATATDVGAAATPLVAEDGTVTLPLSPANTRIEFVGTHVGEKPDPRKGGFEAFTGKLQVDGVTKSLKGISLDIDTASLKTEIAKLTTHLKSEDFFDVNKHPKATFETTKVEPSAETPGQLLITGNLTLLGKTKEITAPVSVQIGPEGPSLRSELTLDRSEFGMEYKPEQIENKVALTVVIGQLSPSPAQP